MSNTTLYVEIMDGIGAWHDVTGDVKSASISVGLSGAGSQRPRVGRCELLLSNRAKAYNPDVNGAGSALMRARARLRVRAASASLGNCLQATHNGGYGWGGTTTITATGSSFAVWKTASAEQRIGQSFLATAGQLSQITVTLAANTGTPSGTMTWEIQTDSSGKPSGTILSTGTFTPVASSTNTITVAGGAALADNVSYWLVLRATTASTAGNNWNWQGQLTSTYAGGNLATSADGVAWTATLTSDAQCSVTTVTITNSFKQTITRALAASEVWTLQFDARSQYDSQYNAWTAQISTDAGVASQALALTNKWQTYSMTLTTTGVGTYIYAIFWPMFVGNGLNSTITEFRNVSLTKPGTPNILTNGDFASGVISPWIADTSTVSTTTIAVARDSWIRFNGVIKTIQPAPFANGGPQTVKVVGADYTEILRRQKVTGLALQKNQRGDQLASTVLALLPPTGFNALPGKLLDTGLQTFQRAFDGITKATPILDLISDVSDSEYGAFWLDLDGTFRWSARDYVPKRVFAAAKLTLAGAAAGTVGQPIDMLIEMSDGLLVNKVNLIWHPRQTVTGTIVLGQITNAVLIPPKQSDGTPGTTTVTLTFRDSAGRVIGGDSVITPLVANTDYTVNERADGTGPDYTTDPAFGISVTSVDASQITVQLTNTATGPLNVTKLQCRGNGVYSYDPITVTASDAASIAAYQECEWTKDMPFANDQNFTTSLAAYIVSRLKTPFVSISWIAADWRDQIGGVDVLSIELMDLLAITDDQTGLTTPIKHLVIGANYSFTHQAGNYVGKVTWELERIDDATYWILGDATYGVLGTSTRLYI